MRPNRGDYGGQLKFSVYLKFNETSWGIKGLTN